MQMSIMMKWRFLSSWAVIGAFSFPCTSKVHQLQLESMMSQRSPFLYGSSLRACIIREGYISHPLLRLPAESPPILCQSPPPRRPCSIQRIRRGPASIQLRAHLTHALHREQSPSVSGYGSGNLGSPNDKGDNLGGKSKQDKKGRILDCKPSISLHP